ncbi:hypothetical protein CBR_g24130 [Chara braunii]|uniref:Zinc knuckle CX2CX4HX4C domain-containing protein n=1 Tax=Chara braunii TaxID=69332 RepID=A0A388L5W8_CHABU|nr:hypothetical protein CBR_g24130 [Chara braunii]|eukprot:GBG77684.1 hypothetical protein CBR_g24130 [Chara braunii]
MKYQFFWIRCLQVLVFALPVLEEAVEAAFGNIIKSYSAFKEPTAPELLNIRFDLTTSAIFRYKPYLTIDLSEFGFVNIEVVCADTPWCPDCRRYFHFAGDVDCTKNKRQKSNPQKTKGKAPVAEKSGKENDKGHNQKEKTSKQKNDPTNQPQGKRPEGNQRGKNMHNGENLGESSKGWHIVVWQGQQKKAYVPKGAGSSFREEVPMNEDGNNGVPQEGQVNKRINKEKGEVSKEGKRKPNLDDEGQELREEPESEGGIGVEEHMDLEDLDEEEEDGDDDCDLLIRHRKVEKKIDIFAKDEELRDIDFGREANPFSKLGPDARSDSGQKENPLIEVEDTDKEIPKDVRLFVLDEDDLQEEGKDGEMETDGQIPLEEGVDGEEKEEESGEEPEEDLLGVMGKELDDGLQRRTEEGVGNTAERDLDIDLSTPVARKTTPMEAFKIYDNSFYGLDSLNSQSQNLGQSSPSAEEGTPFLFGGSGILLRGGRKWNETLRGASPSKRKKGLKGRGIDSYSEDHSVSMG